LQEHVESTIAAVVAEAGTAGDQLLFAAKERSLRLHGVMGESDYLFLFFKTLARSKQRHDRHLVGDVEKEGYSRQFQRNNPLF
jgi:hypothetical protein